MRPQDIVVLLKILCINSPHWYSKDLAAQLSLSVAEVSNSLNRSAYSGLIDTDKKKVRTQSLIEFLIYGLPYVFPQRPGNFARGIPTAHSHPEMRKIITADQVYVWPDAEGTEKGMCIDPLYPGLVAAVKKDERLYQLLALVDILRIGKAREKEIAIEKLKEILNQ